MRAWRIVSHVPEGLESPLPAMHYLPHIRLKLPASLPKNKKSLAQPGERWCSLVDNTCHTYQDGVQGHSLFLSGFLRLWVRSLEMLGDGGCRSFCHDVYQENPASLQHMTASVVFDFGSKSGVHTMH
eukprot:1159884-Pelagomonas_calceolata.AAC.3